MKYFLLIPGYDHFRVTNLRFQCLGRRDRPGARMNMLILPPSEIYFDILSPMENSDAIFEWMFGVLGRNSTRFLSEFHFR